VEGAGGDLVLFELERLKDELLERRFGELRPELLDEGVALGAGPPEIDLLFELHRSCELPQVLVALGVHAVGFGEDAKVLPVFRELDVAVLMEKLARG